MTDFTQVSETLADADRFRCLVRTGDGVVAGTVVARLVAGRVTTAYDAEMDDGSRRRFWPDQVRAVAPTEPRRTMMVAA